MKFSQQPNHGIHASKTSPYPTQPLENGAKMREMIIECLMNAIASLKLIHVVGE